MLIKIRVIQPSFGLIPTISDQNREKLGVDEHVDPEAASRNVTLNEQLLLLCCHGIAGKLTPLHSFTINIKCDYFVVFLISII